VRWFAPIPGRVWTALRSWPSPRGWLESAIVALTLALALAVVGGVWGLLVLAPARAPLLVVAAAVFFAPALGEELVFRAALTPSRREIASDVVAIVPALLLFLLWHVVEAVTFHADLAPVFLTPAFLASAALIGLACAIVRRRTDSLWPAVLIHWAAVFVWSAWLGGPPGRA
jgi:predicted Abi (CAAX) family protease